MRGVEGFLKTCALIGALGVAASAYGAAGTVTTTVTPITTNVTYSIGGSQPMTTYIAYTVDVVNAGGNTINNITFTGSTSVTDAQESAVFHSAEGATCVTTNPGGTAISCSLGQFPAGAGTSFVVFFVAPIRDLTSPTSPDNVTFSGATLYAEQGSGNNPPRNSNVAWPTPAPVLLGTENPTNIKTAVPRSGGSFYTGAGAVSTASDPITTLVTIPTLSVSFTTATVDEAPLPNQASCANFTICFGTQLTIEGTFSPFATYQVREDTTNIKPGTKIESVTVQYTDADNVTHPVGLCASPTTPRADGLPCIAKRTHYKNSRVTGWTPDLDGDFEWLFISIKNGRFGLL
jgi:hypothetical protein